jgi:transposase InsO family protein
LCEISNVSRSGYYKWLKRADELDKDHGDYLKIKEVFERERYRYGWRRIKMELETMNHKKIQRLMRKYDLRAVIRKRNPYREMMRRSLEHRTFTNKLQRRFNQLVPSQFFCTDITYIPFKTSFAYLSVVKDIASGEIVSWELSLQLDMQFIVNTIENMRNISCAGAVIHSDQGFHYTNPLYINVVKSLKMIQSMSAKGKCIDNAPIESFFGHMKDELDYRSCKTFSDLRLKITEYMKYYNYERKQWTRKKMTPIEYRNHLLIQRVTG